MTERETIEALPTELRAPYKAALVRDRVVAFGIVKGTRIRRGPFTIEFDDSPRIITNGAGSGVAIDAMVRVFDTLGRELRIDPHRICVNPPILVPDGTVTTQTRTLHGRQYQIDVPGYREDPLEAYLRWLIESIEETPAAKGFRTRGTVTTFYSNTDDSFVDSYSGTYANARDGTGSFYVPSVDEGIVFGYSNFGNYYLDMAFFRFDTSSIADTDSIDDVDLSLWGLAKDEGGGGETLEVRSGYTWSGSGVTSADWRTGAQFEALTLCATMSLAIATEGSYQTFTENGTNFRSAINKTGYTELVGCTGKHRTTGVAPSGPGYWQCYGADASGTTNDPKLVVTHTSGIVTQSVAGSMPAASGTLSRIATRLRTVTGSMPAQSGTLARVKTRFQALAGNMPSASATLVTLKTRFQALAGSMPSPSATLATAVLHLRTLTGSMPSASGTLATVGTFLRTLTGNMPSATGTVGRLTTWFRTLTGDFPAASGTISRALIFTRSLVGNMPAATGQVVKSLFSRTVAGNMPSASGTIARLGTFARTLTGSLPAPTATLSTLWTTFEALVGNMPAAAGTIARELLTIAQSLAGALPSPSGVLTTLKTHYETITGDMPAPSAVLSRMYSSFQTLTGNMPSATGAISDAALFAQSLAGTMGAWAGSLATQFSAGTGAMISKYWKKMRRKRAL